MNNWVSLILVSAILLGVYDFCKKHGVRGNAALPVLACSTTVGAVYCVFLVLVTGKMPQMAIVTPMQLLILAAKTLLVCGSWFCSLSSLEILPLSLAAPVFASAPLVTFLGGVFIFHEAPSLVQYIGMVTIFSGLIMFSMLGNREGFAWNGRGMCLALTGAFSSGIVAIVDKFVLGKEYCGMDVNMSQFYYSLFMSALCLSLWGIFRHHLKPLTWRWSIPLIGIMLITSDWLYFRAIVVPDAQIGVLGLMRRISTVVAFGLGAWYFREKNITKKALGLMLILAGAVLLSLFK